MISEIRKSFESKSYKIVMWLTILALAGVFSIPQIIKDLRTSSWIAKVNGYSIPYADFVFKAQMQEARINMLRQQYGQLADMLLQSLGASADPKVFALESLIKESLIAAAARNDGVRVSSTFVAEKLASPLFVQQELSDIIPSFVLDAQHGINMQALRSYLQRVRMSMSDLEEKVDRVIERKVFMDFVAGSVYVPDFIIKEQYIADHLAKRYSLLRFNFGDYVVKAKKSPVSADELKAFFDAQNKSSRKYAIPEQRSGKLWAFDVQSYGVSVDEDAVAAYYNDHKKTEFVDQDAQVQVRRILFKVGAQQDFQVVIEKANKLKDELAANPALFAQKAKELSDDAESAKQDGLMPFFTRGSQHKSFDRAAFLLQNDGDISSPIVTDKGVEIIQRVAKKAATFKPLASVKKEIEKNLVAKKFKTLFGKDAQQATKNEARMQELLARAAGKPEVIPTTAVNDDVLRIKSLFRITKEGDYAFFVADDRGYIVQATAIKKTYLPTLDEVKSTVEQHFYENQAADLLKKDMIEAQQRVKATDFATLKAEYKASLEQSGLIKRADAEMTKQLQKKGLPVEKMLSLTMVGSVTDALVDLDGYLIKLDEVEPFNDTEFAQKHHEIKAQLQSEYGRITAEGFVASLGRNATITINESLVTQNQ